MVNGQGQQDIFIIYIRLLSLYFLVYLEIFLFQLYTVLDFSLRNYFGSISSSYFRLVFTVNNESGKLLFFEDSCCPSFIFKIPYNLLRNFFFKNLRTSSKIFKSCFCTYKTAFTDHPSTLPKAYVINGSMSVLSFVLNNFEYL